jgi:hypothetical protein
MIEEGLSCDDGWPDIVQDLMTAGLNDEEVAALLCHREVWTAEARELKTAGYPYDEIISHLITLRASWADVGRALMVVGLSPADMLRAVLPSIEQEEHWPVVQVALTDGPEDADYEEVRGVLGFYFTSEVEVLAAMDLDGVQRELAVQRLGTDVPSRRVTHEEDQP